MKNSDTTLHVQGKSIFIDDMAPPKELLHAVVFTSPQARGKIKDLDITEALDQADVVAIFTADDIPGENQIGGIIQDEALLAQGEVHFIGQPIAVIIGRTIDAARAALKSIKCEIDPLPVLTEARQAFAEGSLIAPSRTFSLGDTEAVWGKCDVVVEGSADSGAQEHFYLEPQIAMALPTEGSGIKLYSSTQAPTAVQRHTATVLNLAMHQIEVDVLRLGGGFGGKEDQATPWAAMAALGALLTGKPVKLALDRLEDIHATGKRHPYTSDYKIGLDKTGGILAYEVNYFQNAGAAADLSTAILERSLFHCTNSYSIPNVKATASSCRTNLPPFTAFRGFGAPQAMFVLECAIVQASEKLGLAPREIQKKNLISENDIFPYGMKNLNSQAKVCWDTVEERYKVDSLVAEIDQFNAVNSRYKRGIAMMPVCFGISFTNTMLNQAGALVHIYTDGSVSVSTGAVEMGQGVNRKMALIAGRSLGLDLNRIRVDTANTGRVANTSPTAASSAADLNGMATKLACDMLVQRLQPVAAKLLQLQNLEKVVIQNGEASHPESSQKIPWDDLIQEAYANRINLSAQAHYATPDIYFDREKEKGKPFVYHVFGTAVTTATLDCLTGTYTIDLVSIVHDAGKSLDPLVDLGQTEGGLVQGIGWMLIEQANYDEKGVLLNNSSANYKLPDIHFVPKIIDVHFLEDTLNPKAIFNSKAIGEPPFMYGIGSYFAVLDAMRAYRKDIEPVFSAPLTPEKVFCYLHDIK